MLFESNSEGERFGSHLETCHSVSFSTESTGLINSSTSALWCPTLHQKKKKGKKKVSILSPWTLEQNKAGRKCQAALPPRWGRARRVIIKRCSKARKIQHPVATPTFHPLLSSPPLPAGGRDPTVCRVICSASACHSH